MLDLQPLFPLAFAIAGLSLVGLGTYAANREVPAYFLARNAPAEQWVAAAPGLSSIAQQAVLNRCFETLMSPLALLQPMAQRISVAQACAEIGLATTAASPASSYAWLVSATSHAVISEWSAMNVDLERAYEMGPHEQWMAARRVVLAEQYFDRLSISARDNEDNDLRLLVTSDEGRRDLANRYVAQSSFRERIIAIVELLSHGQQEAFLAAVTDAANE